MGLCRNYDLVEGRLYFIQGLILNKKTEITICFEASPSQIIKIKKIRLIDVKPPTEAGKKKARDVPSRTRSFHPYRILSRVIVNAQSVIDRLLYHGCRRLLLLENLSDDSWSAIPNSLYML